MEFSELYPKHMSLQFPIIYEIRYGPMTCFDQWNVSMYLFQREALRANLWLVPFLLWHGDWPHSLSQILCQSGSQSEGKSLNLETTYESRGV